MLATLSTAQTTCSSHTECAAAEYCDQFLSCFECASCYQWEDPFDTPNACPNNCRDASLQCQYDRHCADGEYCNSKNLCHSCSECPQLDDGIYDWPCTDRCTVATTTTTTSLAVTETTAPTRGQNGPGVDCEAHPNCKAGLYCDGFNQCACVLFSTLPPLAVEACACLLFSTLPPGPEIPA